MAIIPKLSNYQLDLIESCPLRTVAISLNLSRFVGLGMSLKPPAPETNKEVQRRDLVNGYMFSKNRYLLLAGVERRPEEASPAVNSKRNRNEQRCSCS